MTDLIILVLAGLVGVFGSYLLIDWVNQCTADQSGGWCSFPDCPYDSIECQGEPIRCPACGRSRMCLHYINTELLNNNY